MIILNKDGLVNPKHLKDEVFTVTTHITMFFSNARQQEDKQMCLEKLRNDAG